MTDLSDIEASPRAAASGGGKASKAHVDTARAAQSKPATTVTESWFCDMCCAAANVDQISCELCARKGGVLKQTGWLEHIFIEHLTSENPFRQWPMDSPHVCTVHKRCLIWKRANLE